MLVTALLLLNNVFGQVYTATAKLDTNRIAIGAQAALQIKVFLPASIIDQNGKFVQWPVLTDSINKIEIVEVSKIDTVFSKDQKTVSLTQNLQITCFDTGFFVIPPLRFLKNGDSARIFETQALLLEVKSIQIDTTQAIKDIKPPLEAPYTFKEALPYIIGIVLLAIIFVLIYLYFKKRKKKEATIEKIPEVLPHILALEKLEELKQKKLWQEGKTKLYHTLITEIIRIYLENRYNINALEQTSEEIIISCRSLAINTESKIKLEQVLVLADLVKFAKTQPLPSENDLSHANAVEFVKSTAILEEIILNKSEGDVANV